MEGEGMTEREKDVAVPPQLLRHVWHSAGSAAVVGWTLNSDTGRPCDPAFSIVFTPQQLDGAQISDRLVSAILSWQIVAAVA